MDKRALTILLFIFGGLFLVFFAFLMLALSAVDAGDGPGRGPRVGVVEITDVIVDAGPALEALEDFRKDSRIEGVIVRVDSPGGAVAPTQEIHDAILRVREEKKVVVSMATTAASGGYYLAVAADEIVANAGTLTGSIGVISQFTNLQGLAEWARIDVETIKSGDLKDAGNPFREMTEEERAFFADLLADVHSQFIGAVAQGRGMDPDELADVADGRVLTGQQAHAAGLVDHLGSFDFAVDRIMELAGLGERPALIYPQPDEIEMLREIFGTAGRAMASGMRKEVRSTVLTSGGPSLWFLSTVP